jgi:hypothetical protein
VSRHEDQAIGRVIAAGERQSDANAQIRNLELANEDDASPDVERDLRARLAAAYAHEGRTLKHLRATNLALLRVIRADGEKKRAPDPGR